MMKLASLAITIVLASCGTNDAKPATTAAMRALVIPVDGMACGRCAARVERTLTAIDGVGDAAVSLEQKRVVVHYDPQRLSPDKLVSAIDGAGFKAGSPGEAAK